MIRHESFSEKGFDRVTIENPPVKVTFSHFCDSRHLDKHYTLVGATFLINETGHGSVDFSLSPPELDSEVQQRIALNIATMFMANQIARQQ